MGEVWKARDSRLDRIIALKISRDEFSERFEREARAIAALNHPHICQLYDMGPNYLVMSSWKERRLKVGCPWPKQWTTPDRSSTRLTPRTAKASPTAI